MPKKKGKTMKQMNQSMAAESNNATENISGSTNRPVETGRWEQNNRPV
jgi:hypothetical protein